jgi:mRNA-degrading endonuclease toxin of MazEF toxin-antitoxin module
MFSRGRVGPTRVPIPAGAGSVPFDSVLFCEEITTLGRRAIGEVVAEP